MLNDFDDIERRLSEFRDFELDPSDDVWAGIEREMQVRNGLEALHQLESEVSNGVWEALEATMTVENSLAFLADQEVDVTDDIWAGIEERLTTEERKPIIWWISGVAASLVLLIGAGAVLWPATNGSNATAHNTITEAPSGSIHPLEQNSNETPPASTESIIAETNSASTSSNNALSTNDASVQSTTTESATTYSTASSASEAVSKDDAQKASESSTSRGTTMDASSTQGLTASHSSIPPSSESIASTTAQTGTTGATNNATTSGIAEPTTTLSEISSEVTPTNAMAMHNSDIDAQAVDQFAAIDMPGEPQSGQADAANVSTLATSAINASVPFSDTPTVEPSAMIPDADTSASMVAVPQDSLLPEEELPVLAAQVPALTDTSATEKPASAQHWRVIATGGVGHNTTLQMQYYGIDPPVAQVGTAIFAQNDNAEDMQAFGRAPLNELRYDIPINANIGLEYNVTKRLALGVGVTYTLLKAYNEVFYAQNETKMKYIGVPVSMAWKVIPTKYVDLRVKGFVRGEKMVHSEYLVLNGSDSYSDDFAVELENTGNNLAAGLGLDLMLKVHERAGIIINPQLSTYLKTDTQMDYRRNIISRWHEFNIGFFGTF